MRLCPKREILLFFLMLGLIIYPLKARGCTITRSCPPKCGNDDDIYKYYTAPDTSCNYSECCVSGDIISCYSTGCDTSKCSTCTPPACEYVHNGTDSDDDGYDKECGDCDDSNPRVHPESSEGFCDCNSDTPGSVSALGLSKDYSVTAGIPETTGCGCAEKTSSGRCLKFTPGCLCYDGHDNDCDGLTDLKDPDCPNVDEDWVMAADFTLEDNKDISPNGLYVLAGNTFTVKSGVTLIVGKVGIHLSKGAHIKLEKGAHIKVKK